jgi:hypothetical protein
MQTEEIADPFCVYQIDLQLFPIVNLSLLISEGISIISLVLLTSYLVARILTAQLLARSKLRVVISKNPSGSGRDGSCMNHIFSDRAINIGI